MKHLFRSIAFSVSFFMLLVSGMHAQITNTYTTSTSWAVPAGVTSVTLKLYGGAGGTGGQDCGAGCTNAPAGQVGYVEAVFSVTPGDIIYIYPGGNGVNGSNNITGAGGGNGGVSTYSAAYNGGKGGNAGSSGSSGGGGGGGAASIIKINSTIVIVAGGAGGGGGMANQAGSGQAGNATTSANGTSNTGGNGTTPSGDGGGGGGGGQYGSLGGGVHAAGGESAGNGGYRGANAITGASSITTNGTATWTSTGQIQITYAASTLPVVWQNFSAILTDSKVKLSWTTSMEMASKKFIIQHSPDGRSWEQIGELPAALNSNSSQAYAFVHSWPAAGGNFYRIAEVDQDGQSSFSKVIFVLNDNNSKGFTIYPDPVINKVLNVQSGVGGLFSIYNSMGSQLMQQQLEPGTTQINLHHLSPGVYYIRTNGKATRFVLL